MDGVVAVEAVDLGDPLSLDALLTFVDVLLSLTSRFSLARRFLNHTYRIRRGGTQGLGNKIF